MGHQEDVRRPSEQEPARRPVAVNGRFERGKQAGDTLDLVEHGPLGEVGDEPNRVGLRRRTERVVVERPVGVPRRVAHASCERGLAALARPVDEHHGRVGEGLFEARTDQSAEIRNVSHDGSYGGSG